MRARALLEIDCSGFDDEGLGIGTAAKLCLHVPAAVPGDRLEVVIEHRSPHGPHAWARLLRLLRPSPDRVPPACPNVGRCGGCLMQCAAYPLQLAAKQERVESALAGLSGAIEPCVPSPRLLGYRNKAKLVAAARRDGTVFLGAYAPRSHRVIDMAGCQITEPPLGPVARTLARLASQHAARPYHERSREGTLRHVILRSNHQGRVLAVLVTPTRSFRAGPVLARALRAQHPEVAGVVHNVNPARGGVLLGSEDHLLDGTAELEDRIGPVALALGARSFFQVNRDQAVALYAAVLAAAAPTRRDTVVDLYSGVGGIALTLAPHAGRVIAIESDPEAARCARRSASAAAAANLSVVASDAATGVAGLERADLVILDPPRKGCAAPVLRAAAGLEARRLVYVSCALPSLARDLLALRELGYAAVSTRPFDLFPHTPHIETLTVLDRTTHAA